MTAKIIGDEYKGYKLVSGFGSMVEIKALGKGTVSMELRGLYTSSLEAMKAVDAFEAKPKPTTTTKPKRGSSYGTEQTD